MSIGSFYLQSQKQPSEIALAQAQAQAVLQNAATAQQNSMSEMGLRSQQAEGLSQQNEARSALRDYANGLAQDADPNDPMAQLAKIAGITGDPKMMQELIRQKQMQRVLGGGVQPGQSALAQYAQQAPASPYQDVMNDVATEDNGGTPPPSALAALAQQQPQQQAPQATAQSQGWAGLSPDQRMSALAQIDPDMALKAMAAQVLDPYKQENEKAQAEKHRAETEQLTRVNNMFGGQPQGEGSQAEQLTGDAYLKTLPQTTAQQVKALAEGRMQPPGSMAIKTPYWQQMLQAVSQYDPSFDMSNYTSRAATRKDFTSGKAAQNLTSMNTALGHLDTLQKAVDDLDNFDTQPINSAVNYVEQKFGDPRVNTFNTARDAVADELTRVFRGSGGALADVMAKKANLSADNSPEQNKAVIKQYVDLLGSRLGSMGEQYSQGMGQAKNGVELLSPKAQAAYYKLTGELPPKTHAGNPGSAGGQSAPVISQADIQATAAKSGRSVQEVMAAAQAKGYKIQ